MLRLWLWLGCLLPLLGAEVRPLSAWQGARARLRGALLALSLPLGLPRLRPVSARGAFEMDAEFYLRNLVGGIGGGGTEARRPIYRSPRVMDGAAAARVLGIAQEEIAALAHVSVATLRANVSAQLPLYLPFFRQFAPIVSESLSDQYFFDLSAYLSYLQAQTLIPDSETRLLLRNRVGDRVLDWLVEGGSVPRPSLGRRDAAVAAEGLKAILRAFEKTGLVGSFAFDAEDMLDAAYTEDLFGADMPLSLQITLNEPATLLGAVQMAASDTRFRPDILGAALLRYLVGQGFAVSVEDYLMDNFYRESNDDVQAQSVLLEMQLLRRREGLTPEAFKS